MSIVWGFISFKMFASVSWNVKIFILNFYDVIHTENFDAIKLVWYARFLKMTFTSL